MCGHGLDRSGSGQGQVAGTCERGSESSGFIKCEEFDQLRTGQILKKDSAPCTLLLSTRMLVQCNSFWNVKLKFRRINFLETPDIVFNAD